MHEMFPGISKLLGDLLSFPLYCFSLFLCIDHWGRLYLCAIFWNSAFKWVYLSFSPLLFASLLFWAICKSSSDNHFAFLLFIFGGMVLVTASCTISLISVHSSSGTLSDLIPWIFLALLLYNCKGFDLGHTLMAQWFSLLSSIKGWIWQWGVHDLSHSQLLVLFLLTV